MAHGRDIGRADLPGAGEPAAGPGGGPGREHPADRRGHPDGGLERGPARRPPPARGGATGGGGRGGAAAAGGRPAGPVPVLTRRTAPVGAPVPHQRGAAHSGDAHAGRRPLFPGRGDQGVAGRGHRRLQPGPVRRPRPGRARYHDRGGRGDGAYGAGGRDPRPGGAHPVPVRWCGSGPVAAPGEPDAGPRATPGHLARAPLTLAGNRDAGAPGRPARGIGDRARRGRRNGRPSARGDVTDRPPAAARPRRRGAGVAAAAEPGRAAGRVRASSTG